MWPCPMVGRPILSLAKLQPWVIPSTFKPQPMKTALAMPRLPPSGRIRTSIQPSPLSTMRGLLKIRAAAGVNGPAWRRADGRVRPSGRAPPGRTASSRADGTAVAAADGRAGERTGGERTGGERTGERAVGGVPATGTGVGAGTGVSVGSGVGPAVVGDGVGDGVAVTTATSMITRANARRPMAARRPLYE